MRRRPGQLLVSALTATLALVTVGWAATGRLPLVSGRAAPSAVTAQATGPLVANDHEGRAVLTAEGMAPGAVRTGEVTIGNAGDGAGAFTLSADAAPGSASGGGGLSGVLDLRVLDVSGAEAATVYAGTVRALHRVALGTLAAHEMRRYRFELRFPAGRAAAIDDVHQGASTTVTFTWDAVATGARPLPAPDSAPEPAPVAPAPAAPAPPAPAPAGGGAAAVLPGAPPTAGAPGPRPASPAPAPSPRVALAPPTLVAGHLVTAVSGPAGARARVAGTVIVRGRRLALPPVTARLGARPMTLRLVLPRQALIAGAPRRLRIVLAVTVTGRGARSTVRRTVTVTRR